MSKLNNIRYFEDLMDIKVGKKTLRDYKNKLTLIDSVPMAIAGLKLNTIVDVIVGEYTLWDTIVKEYPDNIGWCSPSIPSVVLGNVRLVYHTVDTPIGHTRETEEIDGMQVWTLESTLKWKIFMGREEDREDIDRLKVYLNV